MTITSCRKNFFSFFFVVFIFTIFFHILLSFFGFVFFFVVIFVFFFFKFLIFLFFMSNIFFEKRENFTIANFVNTANQIRDVALIFFKSHCSFVSSIFCQNSQKLIVKNMRNFCENDRSKIVVSRKKMFNTLIVITKTNAVDR